MKQSNGDIRWEKMYWYAFVYGPFAAGVMLPFVIYSLYDIKFIGYLINHADDTVSVIILSVICAIPFAIVALINKRDFRNDVCFEVIAKRMMFRFAPSFVLYSAMLIDVLRSATMRLPGYSTAPIVLILFPVIGSLFVFIGNIFAKNLNKSN